MNKFIIIYISTIVLITLFLIYYHSKLYDTFLFGIWESDYSFNKSSDINEMKLFIGPLVHNTRKCYLHMTDTKSNIITSQVVNMKLAPHYYGLKYHITLTFEEDDTIIPPHLTLELNPNAGLIRLYDDNLTLYGALYKDNHTSHLLYLEYLNEQNEQTDQNNENDKQNNNDDNEQNTPTNDTPDTTPIIPA